MLVANDVTTDSRVRKEAKALADVGHEVVVLGTAASSHPSSSSVDGITELLVPVQSLMRDEALRRKTRRRQAVLLGVPYVNRASAAAAVARSRLTSADAGLRDVSRGDEARGSTASWHRLAGRLRATAVTRTAQVRSRATHHSRDLWEAWDRQIGRARLGARWRRLHPYVDDLELAFAPEIDRLQPDVVHAHDMHMIGIAARAAERARRAGRRVRWVYDAHEFVPGLSEYGHRTPRVIAGWADLERQYIRLADAVVTVGPAIADELVRVHRLTRRPTVVLNTPRLTETAEPGSPDVRSASGVATGVLLLVYGGGITTARGLDVAVTSLQVLTEAHLSVVCVPGPHTNDAARLRDLAARLGLGERVHLLGPVSPSDVVAFLSTADIGLIPIRRYRSHELALPNKMFEYAFAGLPVVASRLPSMTEFLTRTGVGETHAVDDPVDLARAVRAVEQELSRYRHRALSVEFRHEYSWEAQAGRLVCLYDHLTEGVAPCTGGRRLAGDQESTVRRERDRHRS